MDFDGDGTFAQANERIELSHVPRRSGEVKITADKATNSLVIVASHHDYLALKRVIEKLDIARRQVFVEAVIMEVSLDKSRDVGVSFHGGGTFDATLMRISKNVFEVLATGGDTFHLEGQPKDGLIKYDVKFKKGDFADDWADEGLLEESQKKSPRVIKVTVEIGDDIDCAHMVDVQYTAKPGKWGKTK